MNQKFLKAYAFHHGLTVTEAESEVTRTLYAVAKALAPTFRFGYHSVEDIEQQGAVEALLALEDGLYDFGRPLENFLYAAVRNGLYNYKRKNYTRLEPPCSCCGVGVHPDAYCTKMRGWLKRNAAKQNLMRPVDLTIEPTEEPEVSDDAALGELRARIDRNLPVDLRRDYLRMLEGVPVPKTRRQAVREAVLEIIA